MDDKERSDFTRRIQRLEQSVARNNLDTLLVMTGVNRFYLTGFRSTMGLLVVEPGREATLLVDARYHEMARKEIPEVRVERITQAGDGLARYAQKRNWKRVGYEGGITTRELAMLQAALPHVRAWREAGGLLDDLRVIKSRREQSLLRKAEHLGDAVFQKTLEAVRPGMTEWDIRRILRSQVDAFDAEGESFDCIISAGNNSSKPHAHVTHRVLRRGQPLLIDMGVVLNGYCSDMTRTVFFGKASDKMREIYEVVLAAQRKALAAVRAGVTAGEVDAVARQSIAEAGYGEQFGHGLGHGVGIEIHEAPTLRRGSETVLEPGMVITIEPGVYLPGIGGVRIEDMVIVRREGCENLTQTPKELLEI